MVTEISSYSPKDREAVTEKIHKRQLFIKPFSFTICDRGEENSSSESPFITTGTDHSIFLPQSQQIKWTFG
jgi:hypothetical protein